MKSWLERLLEKAWEVLISRASATNVADKEIVQQFYQICLREVHRENYNMSILTTLWPLRYRQS
jgi:hypothetical protein